MHLAICAFETRIRTYLGSKSGGTRFSHAFCFAKTPDFGTNIVKVVSRIRQTING
jgi:hypothetical protein